MVGDSTGVSASSLRAPHSSRMNSSGVAAMWLNSKRWTVSLPRSTLVRILLCRKNAPQQTSTVPCYKYDCPLLHPVTRAPAAAMASRARCPSPGLTSTAAMPSRMTVTPNPSEGASSTVRRTQ